MANPRTCIGVGINNVSFYSNHGVFDQERTVGNEFVVSCRVEYCVEGPVTDNLTDTVSYADLYEVVKSEMNVPSNLLEHVAYRIVQKIADTWNNLDSIDLKITKVAPPIAGMDGSATVTVHRGM